MKILIVNWSWYPTGGDWTYIENLKELYELNGHEVIPFSTKHYRNFSSDFENYFIESTDYKTLNKSKSLKNSLKAIKNSIYSTSAISNLKLILKEHDIKIAHLHNIHHHLTPAIIWTLKENGVKIIWSLHDYKIICPENSFVSNGKICEKCITGDFKQCTINRCKKNSITASFLASIEAYFYHGKNIYSLVDHYLCPSKFLHEKFKIAGFDEHKMSVSHYCYNTKEIDNHIKNSTRDANNRKYILYVGRIEHIKGIQTLINAITGTGIYLKIAGTGVAMEELKRNNSNYNSQNIEFLGFCNKKHIYDLTINASIVVCPSEWYENFPFAIIESMLLSKPVIGSNIGGIPELVKDGETGLLFEPGNHAELRKCIETVFYNQSLQDSMGLKARIHAENLTGFKPHWNYLSTIIKTLS